MLRRRSGGKENEGEDARQNWLSNSVKQIQSGDSVRIGAVMMKIGDGEIRCEMKRYELR